MDECSRTGGKEPGMEPIHWTAPSIDSAIAFPSNRGGFMKQEEREDRMPFMEATAPYAANESPWARVLRSFSSFAGGQTAMRNSLTKF
jgi:hypothetical protein